MESNQLHRRPRRNCGITRKNPVMTDFKETQKIDRRLLLFLGVVSAAAVIGPLVMVFREAASKPAGNDNALTDLLLIMVGVTIFTIGIFALIYNQRLEIDINKYRLRFRMPPLVKWKEYSPDQLDSFRVEKARWFQQMRKSRMHYNPFTKKWSYMMSRKYFAELKLKNGSTLVLSTNKPDEIRNALEAFMEKGK